MADLTKAIGEGHYARKQLLSRDRLVAWSHRRRFQMAVSLAAAFAGQRVLDYGSGDGTFLALTMMSPHAPAIAAGAELLPHLVDECRERYRDEPRLRFVTIDALDAPEHRAAYDAVFCMEVFEHVVDWEPELARLRALLAPGGRLIISVPVEVGAPLVVKQTVRRIAGWRKVGHYPGTSSYTPAEFVASVFAGRRQHIERPIFDRGDGPFHDHKGFNWMVLRERLRRDFDIERTIGSPFPALGPRFGTQAWFVLRLRA